jgi:hypothetical protein
MLNDSKKISAVCSRFSGGLSGGSVCGGGQTLHVSEEREEGGRRNGLGGSNGLRALLGDT